MIRSGVRGRRPLNPLPLNPVRLNQVRLNPLPRLIWSTIRSAGGLLVISWLVVVAAVPEAFAQVGPPIKLGPPGSTSDIPPPSLKRDGLALPAPTAPKTEAVPPPPPGQAAPAVQGGITVEQLETVGSDSAGTRVERPIRLGATPLPDSLWGRHPRPGGGATGQLVACGPRQSGAAGSSVTAACHLSAGAAGTDI